MATVNPSPFGPKPQFELSSGAPAVGNKLFFYVAGSVGTKQTTYTSSTGLVANTNPVILDALGMPTNTELWFTAGQSYKVVYAPSTDTDPPSSPIWTIDNLLGINDTTSAQSEWVSGPAPTFVSATSFTLVGDQTTNFAVGRRLKFTVTAGTVYGIITVSAFAALTTITAVIDSGVLDSGLSAVSYSVLASTNESTPPKTDAYPIAQNASDRSKRLTISLSGNTTATNRTIVAPDVNSIYGDYHGQCYLSKSGANLLLARKDGNKLIINSVLQGIPDAGVTLAIGAAVANTSYFIYAFMSAGVMTLEFSTTTHATQAGTGVEIKSGDATRTLVGLARTNASPAWEDDNSLLGVLSYFNRRIKGIVNPFTANRSLNNVGVYTELNAEIRGNFLTWADEAVLVSAQGEVNSSATTYPFSSIAFDGTTAEDVFCPGNGTTANSKVGFSVSIAKSGLAEGFHLATLVGRQNTAAAESVVWTGTGTVATRTSLTVSVRG